MGVPVSGGPRAVEAAGPSLDSPGSPPAHGVPVGARVTATPTHPSPCGGRFKGSAGPPRGGALGVTSARPLIKPAGFPGRQQQRAAAGPRARGPAVAEQPQPRGAAPFSRAAMEPAGLFPPFPAACLPAAPPPAPAPPPRAAETTRIITDPISGRSYCKGRLLGKVPGNGGRAGDRRSGAGSRGGAGGLRACSIPLAPVWPGAGCGPSAAARHPHPPRLSRRARSSAGSCESLGLAACLAVYRSRIGFGAPRGACVGRRVPRFPGVLARTAPPHATFPPAASGVCGRWVPVPSPARTGSAAECADWRLTSRQEKPVSMGRLSVASDPLPCAGLSRSICHVERCGVRPWWEEKGPGGFTGTG